MNLKDFIKQTLCEITEAIDETNKHFSECSIAASANPARRDGVGRQPHNVDFDVAVTVESSDTKSTNGGIQIYSLLKASGDMSNESSTSTVSRIKFSVPIRFPYGSVDPCKSVAGEPKPFTMG